MTVSSLSSGTIWTPNYYQGRAYPVTKVTIHEMAAVWTAQRCGEFFRDSTRNASSNYGIGNDGDIKCYVDEDNAAWTSSNWDNDNRAITIEVSNSYMGGDWPISDAAYQSLIKLCADICTRYKITPEYTGTKTASFTEHKMFSATACPGPYIHNLLESGKLIKDVKAAMGKVEGKDEWVKDSKGWWYRYADGTWPAKCWKHIDGEWYYFNKSGYMVTGWQQITYKKKKEWFYFGKNGAMYPQGFYKINKKWYGFDKNGCMLDKDDVVRPNEKGELIIGS